MCGSTLSRSPRGDCQVNSSQYGIIPKSYTDVDADIYIYTDIDTDLDTDKFTDMYKDIDIGTHTPTHIHTYIQSCT